MPRRVLSSLALALLLGQAMSMAATLEYQSAGPDLGTAGN